MPQGIAVLAGLKSVNPNNYGGWNGQSGCQGCELDVDNMFGLLRPFGYTFNILKTADATASKILSSLTTAASKLVAGDILVFYFSGHGGQTTDTNGDEADSRDETICAYDRQIIDDELNPIWLKFKPGVRIIMLSDSCHSGTNFKAAIPVKSTSISADKNALNQMQAQMIHISGCRDEQISIGELDGGTFTKALMRIWNGGQFAGNYQQFRQALVANLPSTQQPEYNEYGPVHHPFRSQKPFSIRTHADLRYNAIWLPANDARPVACGYTLAELQAENGKHYGNGYKMMYQQNYVNKAGERLYNAIWAPANDGRPIVWGRSLQDFKAKNGEFYAKGYKLSCQQSYDIGNGERRYDGIWLPASDSRPIVWGWTLEHFQNKNNECYADGYKLVHQQSYSIGNGERRYDGIWAPAEDTRPIVWGWTLEHFKNKLGDCYTSGYKLFHQQSYDIGGGQIRYDGIWAPANDGRPIVWGYAFEDFLAENTKHSAAGYKLFHLQSYII
jgi:hypothetical protein